MRARYLIAALPLLALLAPGVISVTAAADRPQQPEISSRSIPVIEVDGLRFRDLNRDGRLEPYEDWRLSSQRRASDLVSRMTLEEEAGAVMHGNFPEIGSSGGVSNVGYDLSVLQPLILKDNITSYLTRLAVTPSKMAEQNNLAQEVAERGRLGIPLTVSTDPRHHFLFITGQSTESLGYSKWPETIGFAALRDPALMRQFANIARVEYRATGIQQALSPQVDLYTEPRWARGYGGFGSDPQLARAMARAYVLGFQGGNAGPGRTGVLATIKHWVAYGATINGLDAHNAYGTQSRVDAKSFRLQTEPFLGGFDAHVGAVMPTYAIIEGARVNGRPVEPVAAAFNRQLLTELLRGTYRFKGIVLSDWAVTNDCLERCMHPTADRPQTRTDLGMPWGVEKLTRAQRFAKGMNAGVDQFGGVAEPNLIVDDVRTGLISKQRLDEAVARIMMTKFALGLFESHFVDGDAVQRMVNPPAVASLASKTQAEAQVLLKDPKHLLPLKPGTRVFARGVSADALRAAGLTPVDSIGDAQIALIRIAAPYETLHPFHFIGSRQHEGRLDFAPDNPDLIAVTEAARHIPVIAALFLDRPAVLGAMNDTASAILANFGVADDALLAAVTGRTPPRGRLPFELPSSMSAVERQNPAIPDDSAAPLYRAGFGIAPSR
jgi:beta-glucosidase